METSYKAVRRGCLKGKLAFIISKKAFACVAKAATTLGAYMEENDLVDDDITFLEEDMCVRIKNPKYGLANINLTYRAHEAGNWFPWKALEFRPVMDGDMFEDIYLDLPKACPL